MKAIIGKNLIIKTGRDITTLVTWKAKSYTQFQSWSLHLLILRFKYVFYLPAGKMDSSASGSLILADTPKGFPSGSASARSFARPGTQLAGAGLSSTMSRFGVASVGRNTPSSLSPNPLKSRCATSTWVFYIWGQSLSSFKNPDPRRWMQRVSFIEECNSHIHIAIGTNNPCQLWSATLQHHFNVNSSLPFWAPATSCRVNTFKSQEISEELKEAALRRAASAVPSSLPVARKLSLTSLNQATWLAWHGLMFNWFPVPFFPFIMHFIAKTVFKYYYEPWSRTPFIHHRGCKCRVHPIQIHQSMDLPQ